ncbi:hypothetical protein VPMS16_1395 [Vibrio sp. 16]|nr:hypothetical protein VPMS16_1395 [Vibrio sp. 16]
MNQLEQNLDNRQACNSYLFVDVDKFFGWRVIVLTLFKDAENK